MWGNSTTIECVFNSEAEADSFSGNYINAAKQSEGQ